jgi:hypothetical protein
MKTMQVLIPIIPAYLFRSKNLYTFTCLSIHNNVEATERIPIKLCINMRTPRLSYILEVFPTEFVWTRTTPMPMCDERRQIYKQKQTNSVTFIPQANYTD